MVYREESEWGGYGVRPSAKGWIVEWWSRTQGMRDGYKALVPYSVQCPRGTDPNELINCAGTTNGQAIRYQAESGAGRILRRGHTVR